MLLNLNLLLSLSCSVTASVTYVGPATGWGEGEKSRPAGGAAAPAGRASVWRGDGSPYGVFFLLNHSPRPHQGSGMNGWTVWTCLWVQVSVTELRPQNKDLPVFCNKHNCDRGSRKSKPGICRHSARLSTLLMNPRTVSMGSWLDHIDLLKRPQSGL